MAIVYNCAVDWTYDIFMEDVNNFNINLLAGEDIVGSDDEDVEYRMGFIEWLNGHVIDFVNVWKASHNDHLYDSHDGYVGDAFADTLSDVFSDYYKDAYGQRPHLPKWYYVHAFSLPMSEDTARMFCADPVEDAIENAKYVREHFD